MDENGISACLNISTGSTQCLIFPPAGNKSLCAGNNDKVGILPYGRRGLDFSGVLVNRDEFALDSSVKAASFGKDIIFNTNAGCPSMLVLGHRAYDVNGVAKAVITIGNHRNIHCGAHPPHCLQGLAHCEDIGIRHGIGGRDAKTAGPDGIKSGLLGQSGGESIVCPQNQSWTGLLE